MAVLADAIKILDPVPDKKTQLTLALNLLTELAENKVAEFEVAVNESYRTAGTAENRTAPITSVVAVYHDYRAYVKDDASKIVQEVSSAIQDFVAGGGTGIISGIAKLVSTGMTALLGAGQATQQEMASYYITSQSRALVRYDVRAWRRLVEAEGITSQLESCVAVYASKASIDVSQLDLNTFLLAYENQLYAMNFSDEQVLEYIDTAEAVYERLKNDAKPSGGSPAATVSTRALAQRPSGPGNVAFYPPLAG